jgi:acid phosphatase (class A)
VGNFKKWLFLQEENLEKLKYGRPKQDAYLVGKDTPDFDSNWKTISLPEPPKNDSQETQQELKQILKFRNTNSSEVLKRIEEQDREDLETCFIELLEQQGETLDKSLKEKIVKVSEELSTISLSFKIKFDRPRPFQILKAQGKDAGPKGKTTDSPSYPSTHAVIGTFMGAWLSRLYPKHRSQLRKLGKEIGDNRVKAGFHFQSDCDTGNWLAKKLMQFFKL